MLPTRFQAAATRRTNAAPAKRSTSQNHRKVTPVNISQAARLSGLSAKQIRDYEKLGLLPPRPPQRGRLPPFHRSRCRTAVVYPPCPRSRFLARPNCPPAGTQRQPRPQKPRSQTACRRTHRRVGRKNTKTANHAPQPASMARPMRRRRTARLLHTGRTGQPAKLNAPPHQAA